MVTLIGTLENISPRVSSRREEVDSLTRADTRLTRKSFDYDNLSSTATRPRCLPAKASQCPIPRPDIDDGGLSRPMKNHGELLPHRAPADNLSFAKHRVPVSHLHADP